MIFSDRKEAGELLLTKLESFKKLKNLLVIAIPRGGVIIGKVVANKLKVPLDIIVIKKIGAPYNQELAIGAVGPKNSVFWDNDLIRKLNLNKTQLAELKNQKIKERNEREYILRQTKKPLMLKNKTVILVDDGVATGSTVLCAQKYLKKQKVKILILAAPVIAKETYTQIRTFFDRIITLNIQGSFYAVGQFYRNFPQITDEEVVSILNSK